LLFVVFSVVGIGGWEAGAVATFAGLGGHGPGGGRTTVLHGGLHRGAAGTGLVAGLANPVIAADQRTAIGIVGSPVDMV
jgi:hypothetical protein